jgi:ADP-ribose pyrophosphatase
VRETIYVGRIVQLEIEDGRWEIVRHADAVAILAHDERGRVLGVWQHRPAIGRRTWELPAGLIDAGETPVEAAARELAEEAGLAADLRLLTRLYASPGFCDELVYLFEARALHAADAAARDPGEDLELEWRDPVDTWQAIADGHVATSGVTALGLRHLLAERGAVAVEPVAGRPR